MNTIWGANIGYTPDYWPIWLIIGGLLIVAILGVLILHGILRCMLRPKNSQPMVEHRTYLYPLTVRLWHACNALLFILLLLSGVMMHFTLGSVALMLSLHNICGYLLIVSWLAFITINLFGGNGHHYLIQFQGWIDRCFKQVRFYLFGIMKGESHPFPATERCKFNPLQQVAYLGVMYGLVPLLLITGLLCVYPILPWGLGYWVSLLHSILAICSVMFIFGHIYLCTTGDTMTQSFKSMADGYHRHGEPAGKKSSPH